VVAQLVDALHYKLEGGGLNTWWCPWGVIHCLSPSSSIVALGSTHDLTGMRTRFVCRW